MKVGTGLVQSGLSFGYDVSDDRYYLGEPTTNILPSPQYNGEFTTSNGWSTYNTNQYNSNTYFSIGTVGSVTNNIVTLSSVGRSIRSFDVLRAQTSGGGVTAGTDYVIKKITDNSFSLHGYNGSQNGSQGYINPVTGFYKVHDDWANDTRVSISASGFPTMWWGAPHLPNSGLIKEVVEGGGRRRGTNCMRLHVYRGDGVADGMAYGVNTSVTQGDVITVTYYVRAASESAENKGGSYTTYFGPGNAAGSGGFVCGSVGEWVKTTHQWTASATYGFISYFFPQGSGDPYSIDIADMQVEINKGHSSKFVAGTRSATETLYNVKTKTAIDLSYVSFNDSNNPYFDGVDDFIVGTNTQYTTSDVWTAEMILNPLNAADTSWNAIFGGNLTAGGYFMFHGGGQLTYYEGYINGGTRIKYFGKYIGSDFPQDTYTHLVIRYNGNSTYDIFINNDKSTHNYTFESSYSMRLNRIGAADSRYGHHEIPAFRFYERGLSDGEIGANFKAYQGRFNI